MSATALEIDPTGKSLNEVVELLRKNGFSVDAVKTDMWDERAKVLRGATEPGPPVHVVWIKDEEAPLLTVKIFNGNTVTLKAGHDLHLFDRFPDEVPGQDWAVVKSLDIMR